MPREPQRGSSSEMSNSDAMMAVSGPGQRHESKCGHGCSRPQESPLDLPSSPVNPGSRVLSNDPSEPTGSSIIHRTQIAADVRTLRVPSRNMRRLARADASAAGIACRLAQSLIWHCPARGGHPALLECGSSWCPGGTWRGPMKLGAARSFVEDESSARMSRVFI